MWLITATTGRALQRAAAQKPSGLNHLHSGDSIALRLAGERDLKLKLLNRILRIACGGMPLALLLVGASMTASAQFKETPPAPYSPAVARQKIRALLDAGDADKRQQTVDTLSGLLVWYRDILDDELIAAWKGDQRASLPGLMPVFADSRVAAAVVEFSWRQQRAATFTLAYAPMLGDLMARYASSADPFIRDFTGPADGSGQMPDLSPSEAEAVCRILLDMPDIDNWKKIALRVLPYYRVAAQNLLVQDLRGNDEEKSYRAQRWMNELRFNVQSVTSEDDKRRKLLPRAPALAGSGDQIPAGAFSGRPHIVDQPSASFTSGSGPYSAPESGTLKCSGDSVPPNAGYVFAGLPLGNLQIDLDGKPWEARLAPGTGQTQDLILINRSSSPQKRCTVRWRVIP